MLHLRQLIRPLAVIALLATGLALVAGSPAGAQSTAKVFKFKSAETEPGEDDPNWEVQISAQALGGCNPPGARSGHVSGWIAWDGEDGEVLDPGTCNYRITAVARKAATPAQLCTAELRWGASGDFEASIHTSDGDRGEETTIEAQHKGGDSSSCSAQPVLAITIDPEEVVQELPASAKDSNLLARAERAAEITEFRVKVTPKSTSVNRAGCNQTLDFFVHGDGEEAEKALGPIGSGATCEFTIKVTEAPRPFVIAKPNGTSISTVDKNENTGQIEVDLSEHVTLPYNRIVIIQDVANNPGNQGTAAYKITSVCAGVAALPPIATAGGSGIYTLPGGQTVASLNNGRYTVHSPNFANFGPGASYGAVATSTTSDEIGGCAVTATVEGLPAGCTVAGSATRTLTWTEANPIQNFDFEFDIYCGGTQPPEPEIPPPTPPSTGDSSDSSDSATDDAAATTSVGTPNVRIVARLLDNGKIEFGLQQVQHNNSWGDRVFPRARLFPAETAVGRWLVSSPITISAAEGANDFAEDIGVRIVARKLDNGRVEFGLQQRDNGSWGDRVLPPRRYFPPTATVDRWLGSSTIELDL